MSEAETNLRQIDGIDVDIDEVRIPHTPSGWIRVVGGILVPLPVVLGLQLWSSGGASVALLGLLLICWLGLVLIPATLAARVAVRPGHLAIETLVAGRVVRKQVIPLQTIRRVQIVDPTVEDIGAGCLRLHLVDQDTVRIYPNADPFAASMVGRWLQEVVSRQITVDYGETTAPKELQALREAKPTDRESR